MAETDYGPGTYIIESVIEDLGGLSKAQIEALGKEGLEAAIEDRWRDLLEEAVGELPEAKRAEEDVIEALLDRINEVYGTDFKRQDDHGMTWEQSSAIDNAANAAFAYSASFPVREKYGNELDNVLMDLISHWKQFVAVRGGEEQVLGTSVAFVEKIEKQDEN